MEPTDKLLAEAVLKRLCLGSQIDGVRFGPILQVLITNHNSHQPVIQGQVYLNLCSRWAVFDSHPSELPHSENDLPEIPQEQEIQTICQIRERVITNIELGADYPHLIITFDDGKVFFLNGQDDQYESWQLGVALGNRAENWLVVACPGGSIAVGAPEDFLPT